MHSSTSGITDAHPSTITTQSEEERSTVLCRPVPGVSITHGEFRFVLGVSVVVLVITSLPYVFGYLSSPPDKQFMGLILNVADHCQYFAWLKEFRTAHLISNTLTPEPNPPIFFNLLWWTLARIGNLTRSEGYGGLYQAFRWVACISFLFVLYTFCALVFDDRSATRVNGVRQEAEESRSRRSRFSFRVNGSSHVNEVHT